MRGFNMVQLLVLVLFAAAGNPAAVTAAALNSQLQQQVQADTALTTTAAPVKTSIKSHNTPEYVASASTWRQQAPSAAAAPGFAGQPSQADAARGQGHVAANSTPQQQIQDPGADTKRSVKPLWPLDGIDFALLGIIMFSLSLAGGAGIGGGAILVPVYLMLRGWPTAIAVALSNVTILGGSFANFICNVTRHRPNGKRTIDWELILMMEPTTIAGALVGAVANKLLPNWFITYLLAILLTLMALRLYSKGKQTYAKETQLLLAAKAAAKERRKSLVRSDTSAVYARQRSVITSPETGLAGGASNLPTSSRGVAVPAGSRSFRRSGSYNNALSRSFSRLRGSLVVGFEPGTSLTSPGGIVPGGGTPPSRSLISSAGRYSLTARGEGQGEDVVGDGTGQDQQQQPGVAVERYIRSTLFQGDVGDGYEPIVALPASDDLSHASSDVSDHVDVEEGDHAAEQTEDQLLQPLLSDDGASADDIQHLDQRPGRAATGANGNKDWQDARTRQDSSDLTIQLGPVIETTPKEPIREPSLPWQHFLTLLGLSAWVVAADIAQDSFRCGSWQYWASQVSVLIPVIVILAVCRQILLRKYNHDSLPEGYQLQEGELHWTRRTTILYPLLCSSAGLIAGLFGIGGGVVKGPLMLELGVPADVAAATSATMIMFTAGSACLVYSRFGQILYDYAVVLVLLGFTITLCSQLLTFLLIKLLGRRSVIVFMMVALMAAATGIMYVQSGLVTADLVKHPEDLWKFGSICPADRQANLLVQLGQAVMARLQ